MSDDGALVTAAGFDCKSLNLSFQSLSREIATCHSSHGGKFGERIDSVKDAIGRSEERPSQAPGFGTGFAGASDPRALTRGRVLDRIDSASQIRIWRRAAAGKAAPIRTGGPDNHIAGIYSKDLNVLGLMPHPENLIDPHVG
jgi:hypothetical protein